MKWNKWKYRFMASILSFLILCDVLFTMAGINMGFNEGNPIILWIMLYIGTGNALILTLLFSVLLVFSINAVFKRSHATGKWKPWMDRFYWFVIITKIIIVSVWFGMITSFLRYKAMGCIQ